MKIKIQGTIIPDDYADVYDWLGLSYTSPQMIELPKNQKEDIEVEINSYGGDVYSGSVIYSRLKAYQGKVTVHVVGIAASMASIIAMAGDEVLMSPTSQMMIHNVSTITEGDKRVMSHEAEVLHGYDRTLANAYRLKTGMSESDLLDLMSKETWMTPQDAVRLGFADGILFDDDKKPLLVAAAPSAVFLTNKKIEEVRGAMKKDKYENEEEKNVEETEEQDVEAEETESEPEAEDETETEEEQTEEESTEESDEEEESQEEASAKAPQAFANVAEIGNAPSAKAMPKFSNEAGGKILKTVAKEKKEMNYKQAFLNYVRGAKMDAESMQLITEHNSKSNEFVHTSENTGIVIPKETQDKIWARMVEGYNVLEDVKRMNVHGELRIVKHGGIKAGDAKWYAENTTVEQEENEFLDFVLGGHQLAKAITVSWKLRAMSMDDFEQFLIDELSQRISVALGTAVVKGTGNGEATGIVTALAKSPSQLASVETTGKLTYADLTKAIAKVHSSYKNGAAIYANSNVIWTVLANVVDQTGQPFFMPSAPNGVGNIFGLPVKEDAALGDDQILIGNAQGYVLNINGDISLATEDHARALATDYVAYMIADGNVLDEQAFALLSLTKAV